MRPDSLPYDDASQVEVNERITLLIWATFFFAVAVFAKLPGLDLVVSSRYWRADGGFLHAQDALVAGMYAYTPWIGRGLLVCMALFAVCAPAVAKVLMRQSRSDAAARCAGPWRRVAALAALAAAMGNGVVVEGVLKNTVGRPRPVQTIEFGGAMPYTAPFHLGPSPNEHRSFTSGHAATGFSLMCLGLGCGAVWRRRWLLIGIVAGSIVGFGRILQGGHYVSDVVFSFYAIWLSCELVAWLDRRRLKRSTQRGRHAPP